MQTGKEKTSNKKILTLATVLLVVLLQPAVATVTVTGTLSSNESASGSVYAGIVDMNANPIDWSNTVESSWVGNFTFPANFTSFQVEFFNVNVGYEYYLIVFVDQDSNGYPDANEIGAIHGPFYLSSNNFNVGDIPLFTGGASGGGGGTGGMIEGTVGSGESTYGTAIVGLFDIPDPSNWSDRIAERHLGSQSFPNYGIWFDFQEDFIFDSEYVVAAFIDENGDQQPDAMEAIGMASVTVTGGYGNTGDINMSYGGGGGGGPTYIEVTSPDYMSNWSAGTGEYIDWNSTSDGDYDVDIELYKGGSYYEEIEGGYQSSSFGGNFWWSIPGYLEDGNDYQIRVYHVDSGVGDYSDYFQISGGGGGGGGPSYIDVTSPNSMSNWSAGSGESIEWNSTSDGNYAVDIELWKEGSLYELIESGNPSESWGSSYWWTIPAYLEDGNDYEIRVLHVDSGVDGFSDNFQISGGGGGGAPTYIQVTSPVWGSVWDAGSEESISWSSDGSDYEVDIELWRDDNYYQWIVGQYPSSSSEDYQWYIPNNIPEGSNYQIRVYPLDYVGVEGFSDYFQITGGSGGGFVSGNIHSDESVSGELVYGLFSPDNDGEDWDPDWWNNQYVNFPTDEFYFFEESGISDGYGYEVWAYVDANSNYSPDPEELQGKSGAFEVLDGFATNIDLELNFGSGTGGYSVDLDGNTSVKTDFSAYDGGPGFTFELFFKPFYVPESGETFELFRREDWGILQYDGTQQKFIFGLYGIGQIEYSQSLVTDEWYHIAAEYDESKLRLYLNGNYSEYNSPGGFLPNTPSDDTFIGENLEGLIDIVRMSDTGIYNGNNFDPFSNDYSADADVHLLWHCDEGGGADLLDASGNGHTGYIYGNPAWNTDEPLGGGDYTEVNVVYPNGGETFTEGDQMTIMWDWIGGSVGLDIYLSQNSGGSFDYFIGSASATDESYNWTIPDGVDSPNCRISILYTDSPATYDASDNDFTILDSEGALGEFSTEHEHLYWAAEEGSEDTTVVLISNVGNGELKIDNITSSEPSYIYPAESGIFPIMVTPGDEEAVFMAIVPPAGPGTWNGTITFELDNATAETETIDYSVEVYGAGEVGITNSSIDNIELGFYDLIDQVSMTIDFSSLSSDEGELFVTLVDGALPANPDGDSPLAVGDRYWEILSNLEDGDFTADLCFDLNDLEGIDDFSTLKILKRTAYSDGTWEEINSSDIEYDEENSLICANDQSSFSEWIVGSDSTSGNFVVSPPTISGSIPSSVTEGEDITFVVQIVADGGLDRALLKYYVGGDAEKESTFNQVSGDNYEATIPGDDVTSSGLIGFIAARDSLMQETFTDTADILVEHYGIPLHSTSAETYRMISLPGNVYNGNLGYHFEEELGPYDPSVWRMFRWNGTAYSETNFDMFPGEAYWIITRDPAGLTSAEGSSMEMMTGSTVNLSPGWNMVANPYNFSLSVSDLQYNDGDIEPDLYRYTGSGYSTTNSFLPCYGVWIFANTSTSILFDPLGAGSAARSAAEELTWHGSVKATSGDLTDTENVFGAHIGASTGWDVLDRHEPPVIGDYVTLAFDNDDWANHPGRYSRDIRSDAEAGHIWPFTVITNQSGYVSLSVELPEALPAGWEVYLLDRAFDKVQNLSVESVYDFTAAGSETPREFELLVGPPEFTREALDDIELTPSDYRLAQNIPNPFNAVTTIQFSLPAESEVNLTVYDLVGRKVAEPLTSVPFESGSHFLIWDGKDSQDRPVSSGVYFYRLEAVKNGQTKFAKTRKLILLK